MTTTTTPTQIKVRRYEAGRYYINHNGYHVTIERYATSDGYTGDWEVIIPQHGTDLTDPNAYTGLFPHLMAIVPTKAEAVAEAIHWLETYGDQFAN